jgi:ADP-ribose pyrophosphatase YjhB (NUDIX family)
LNHSLIAAIYFRCEKMAEFAREAMPVFLRHGSSWSLPKGHIDPGEDPIAAAKREIPEESGVDQLQFTRGLGTYQRPKIGLNGSDDLSELKTIAMSLFTTSQQTLKPTDPDNPEAPWMAKADVSKLLTHPKDKEFFEQLRL